MLSTCGVSSASGGVWDINRDGLFGLGAVRKGRCMPPPSQISAIFVILCLPAGEGVVRQLCASQLQLRIRLRFLLGLLSRGLGRTGLISLGRIRGGSGLPA